MKRALPFIFTFLLVVFCHGQSPGVKKEGGKYFSDAFVHAACELYDWHEVENALAKRLKTLPARCNDFFNYIFRGGLASMNEYLQLVEQREIDRSNALQYWLDKLPFFEKLYWEKYEPMTRPAAFAKEGNNSVQTGGANCNNLDFYLGTTAGWTGQWNNMSNGPGAGTYGALTVNGFHNSGYNLYGYAHELCTGGTDRNVPVSCVPPGHSYAMRLGNDSAYQVLQNNGNNPASLPYNHQMVSNTFLVTQQNKAVSYWYAVVLCQYNPNNHASTIQPYFKIRMYDGNGVEIMCAHYDVDALTAPTIGGFTTISSPIYDPVTGTTTPYDFFYKPWSQVMIPLNNYVGQNVTITFETSDCAGGGHPGYAYVTVDCAPMPNITVSPFTCAAGGSVATLTAPAGAATYSWAGPGIVGASSSQTANVNAGGSYTVTMTTLGNSGFNCTFSVDTTIAPPPPAIIASFTANSVCPGAPMQFTDQSTTSGGTITAWNWNFGDGSTSNAFNPTHAYASASGSPYTVTYTVTNSGGCTATYSAQVTVLPPPAPAFTTNTVCIGGTTSFTNTTPSATLYSWNFGDGSASSSQTNPSHTYPSAGTYTATLIATGANTCTASVSAPALVQPLPIAAASAGTVCLGSPTNFANSSAYSGTAAFTWNFGDASTLSDTSSLQNPSYIYPAAGTYVVSLSLSAGIGCNDNTTFTVSVAPLPSASVTSPPPCCPGATVPSPVLTSTPSTGVTYNWSNNNAAIGLGAFGSGAPPSFTAGQNTSTGNMTGIISITPYLNGCAGAPATQTITILPAPVIMQPNVDLCPYSVSGAINFTTVPAGVAASFTWTNTTPGNFIGLTQTSGNGSIPSFTAIDPGANPVSIYITATASYNGCDGPPTTFAITANPNPVADFTHSRACEGNNTIFTDASAVSGGTIAQWNWDMNNDGVLTDAFLQNPVYVFPAAGTYLVILEVISAAGCRDTVAHSLLVNASPNVDFSGDLLSGCAVHTVNFTDSCSIALPQSLVSYNWNFGNGLGWTSAGPVTSSFTNASHTANMYYTITLEVTSDSGCVSSVTKTDYITVFPIPHAAFNWDPKDADVINPFIYFYDQSVGASGPKAWTWDFGDPFASYTDNVSMLQNPTHRYSELQEGTYTVTQWVENTYGCRDSVSNEVVIKPAVTFYIPNAFTPGSDGLNDGFKGTGIGIDNATYRLLIFDRWGEPVFESTDLEFAWDGTRNGEPVQQDTYVWKAEFRDVFGKFHAYKGVVNLIR